MGKAIESMTSLQALVDKLTGYLPHVLAAVLTLALFWIVRRALAKALNHAMKRARVDPTLMNFVDSSVRFLVAVVAIATILGQLGIDTSSIVTSLGVVGLTLGFAARDTLSNLIAGLFIFWDRPFVIGDLVEIDGRYGRVERITLRSTRVVTTDGKMLAIPNTTVVNGTVTSYTNFPHLRLDIPVTVAVHENLGKARDALLAVCDGSEFMDTPAPVVVVTALNDYNVALELRVWIKDEKSHVALRLQLRERMFEALRSADVDMPFETIQLAPLDVRKAA